MTIRNRIQSGYYYLLANPNTSLFGPEINVGHLLNTTKSVFDFAMYPGISNCATKMLNGIQCGEDIILQESHLATAKE